jgi:hypothetical protein
VIIPSVGSTVSSHSIVVAAEETAATTAEETAVVVDREVEIIFAFISLCDSSSRGRLPFERGGVVAVRFAYVALTGSQTRVYISCVSGSFSSSLSTIALLALRVLWSSLSLFARWLLPVLKNNV